MRILSGTGEPHRTGFFAYDGAERGGTDLISMTSSALGRDVTVVANGPRLEIRDPQGGLIRTIAPFGDGWTKGLKLGFGVAGGRQYVAVGAGSGGTPYARMYDDGLNPLSDAFLAYTAAFKGGVSVGIGDLDGDGSPDIVTGAGAGGGPHVRVFGFPKGTHSSNDGKPSLKWQFFAYDQKFRGGLSVAVADMDGDGSQEIVTGPGFGGGPQVRVFDRAGKLKSQFFAFDSKKRGGVLVSVGDVDGDGKFEILAMTNDVFTLALADVTSS
jgi:hypothetical protein